MNKILVLGPIGSNAYSTCHKISEKLDLPYHYFKKIDENEDLSKISDYGWIISASECNNNIILNNADTLILLDFSIKECLSSIKVNIMNSDKIDLKDKVKFINESESYLINTYNQQRTKRIECASLFTDDNLYILRNPKEAKWFIYNLDEKHMFHVKQFVPGVIFDFNGTLYEDADINYETWKQTITSISPEIDFEEIFKEFKSTKDSIFISKVFEKIGRPLIKEDIDYWVNFKEDHYRQMCIDTQRNQLRPGAEELLNYCTGNNIPINLCTASINKNVDFYFQNVKLGKWFDRNKVIYDDGNYQSKVKMYQDAAIKIGTTIDQCLVFEDSLKSLREAIMAGCENVVRISEEETYDIQEIKQVISDFKYFDYDLLKYKY